MSRIRGHLPAHWISNLAFAALSWITLDLQ
jgi:hypothetical protein